ncbi:hypothetical protein [Dyella silvatica]|uniref:hypothetical protein n=1 Tax=Dyella silvatica TaxID=2992128 RepID=UPI0022563BA3|nr:hypothetical protein [Dyella silvatica]
MKKNGSQGLVAFFFLIGMCSCPAESVDSCGLDKFVTGHLNGFSAGYREKNFAQMYDSSLRLPVNEGEFIYLLKRAHLSFEVRAEGVGAICHYAPQRTLIKDESITKVYVITDVAKLRPGRGVYFSAFVNDFGQVVYVENNFTYEGP